MRRHIIRLLTSLVIIAVFVQPHYFAQNTQEGNKLQWKLVFESQEYRFYIDPNHIYRTAEGTLICWEKKIPRSDTQEGREAREETVRFLETTSARQKAQAYSLTVARMEYDCVGGRTRALKYLIYANDGTIITDMERTFKWNDLIPDSAGAVELESVCESSKASSIFPSRRSGWITFAPKEEEFSVMMPNQPEIETERLNTLETKFFDIEHCQH